MEQNEVYGVEAVKKKMDEKDFLRESEYVRIRRAWRSGDSTVIPLTGFIEEGRRYSIKKRDGLVIIEDIEDVLKS